MNIKLYNLYGIFGLLPLWIFRSNFNFIEILIVLFIFYLIPLFLHFFFKNYFFKKLKIRAFYIAFLFFYSIDNNIGLWVLTDKFPFFIYSYYIHAVLIGLFIIIVSAFIFIYEKKNSIKVFFIFMVTVLLFNVLNFSKNPSKFPEVNIKDYNNSTIQDQEFVLILDEMSGIESVDSYEQNGEITKKYLLSFLKKNKFNIYTNSFSDYGSTLNAVPTILNGIVEKQKYLNNKIKFPFLNKSNNYFISWNLNENKFFDKYRDSNIVVFQSMFINYCNHDSVIKCFQYNPFKKYNKYLDGFKYNLIGQIISFYKNNVSISGNIFWRLTRHLKLADSLLDPEGEKAILPSLILDIEKEILNEKNKLIFAHLLIPHVPNVFDENCEYSRSRGINYNFISRQKKILQHNIERKCTFEFLDKLFESLKSKKKFENLKITIFSDHDSRIEKRNRNSVLFAIKNKKSKNFSINENIISSQFIFKEEILNK